MNDHTKNIFDWLSLSVVITTLIAWLPNIAALVSIVWGVIRIYETKTVQGWIHKRKARNGS